MKHFAVVVAEELETELEPGRYAVVASHGPEWSIAEREITVASGQAMPLSLSLVHEVDTAGWISGDFHLHAEASFDSGMVFEERLKRVLIEGVDLAIATDHDIIADYGPSLRNLGAQNRLTTGSGVELSTLELGHFIAFPLSFDQSIIPDHGAPNWTCLDGPGIMSLLSAKIDDPKGGVRIMAHPRDGFIGYISQIGLDAVAESRDLSLLEASNVLLAQTSCDIDAMEVFNSKRFDLIRSPTNSEVIIYNRCYGRIDAATDTTALDAACPELSPGSALATCPEGERLSECKQRHRRRLAFLSARDILIRTPEEQVAIWNHTPTGDDGDHCTPANYPDDVPAEIATLPCVDHPGTYDDWMRWLSKGLNVTITGASDSHGNEREPGAPRTWVRQEAEAGQVDVGEAARAVRDGHALASYGPFVQVDVGGKEPGQVASVSGASFDLKVDVRTASWFGVDRIEIYVGGLLERVIELTHGAEVVQDFDEVVSLPVPAEDSFVSVIALGTREDNLMRKVLFDVPFGELQLPRVASLAFGSIPAFALLLTPTPSVPDFFPVFPMATTNAILLDVDGDGNWQPPGPLPSFCARPCTDATEKDVCIGRENRLPTGLLWFPARGPVPDRVAGHRVVDPHERVSGRLSAGHSAHRSAGVGRPDSRSREQNCEHGASARAPGRRVIPTTGGPALRVGAAERLTSTLSAERVLGQVLGARRRDPRLVGHGWRRDVGRPVVAHPLARRDERAPGVECDRGLIEVRVDVRRELFVVRFAQQTPVQVRMHVVDAVEAVVEREPAEQAPDEVARVVPGRSLVGAVVLEEVDGDDAPRGPEVRHVPVEQGFAPIEDEQRDGHYDEHDRLDRELAEPSRSLLAHDLREREVALGDRPADRRHEGQQVHQVPAVVDLGRAHHVAVLLHVHVVRQVVPRHVARHRMSVGQREHDLERLVEPAIGEDRAVDRVVRDDRAEPREARQHADERQRDVPVARVPQPQHRDQREVGRHEPEGATIGFVAQHFRSLRGLKARTQRRPGSRPVHRCDGR